MTPTMAGVNIFSNVLTAVNFMVVAVALIMFMRRTDIGHRTLIRLIIIFATARSVVGWSTAWDLSHGFTMHTAILRAACAIIGAVCVVYFVASSHDVVKTFQTSETADRLRKNAETDKEQARQQMTYLSASTRRRSEALLMQRQTQ